MRWIALIAVAFCAACSHPAPQKTEVKEQITDPLAFQGVLAGSVTFEGKAPKREKVDMDGEPICAGLHKTPVYNEPVLVTKGHLANVFLYIKKGLEDRHFAPPADSVVIDQKGCWFEPRVLGIQVGQTLHVTNSDPLTHSIHPRAIINREWNQNQPEGAPALNRKFTQREIMVPVKCNIHSWMRAWIGVVEHPYFSVTGTDGNFEWQHVPPGTYTIGAWHEALGAQEQTITVPASGKVEINFKFKGE
jgi:plastocyanin